VIAPEPTVVYGLVAASDPSTVRYIGKTATTRQRKRLALHLVTAKGGERTHRANWIRSVLSRGDRIVMVMLSEAGSHEDACRLERDLIASHREAGSPLTNETDGGEGRPGRKLSPDVRAKLSAASKALWQRRYAALADGETFRWGSCPEAVREKISRATAGKKRTSEQRARISDAHRRTWAARADRRFSDDHRRRISKALTGKTPTEATRQKMRASRLRVIAREKSEVTP
jgi:hypothetical protein